MLYSYVSPRAGRLEIGYLRFDHFDWGTGWLEPAQSTPVLRFKVCLEDGTAAGEYPIALTAGALVDAATGKSISPQLTGGTLVVQNDVNTGTDCFVPKPPVCPPPAGNPQDLSATYRLGDTSAGPGQTARIPFGILANAETQMFSLSIDYDEAVVEGVGLQASWRKPDNTPFAFLSYGFYNEDETPGNGGVDEGYFYAVGVFSMTDNCSNIPANRETEVLRLEFRVRPEAPAGSTAIRFLDGALQKPEGSGKPVTNKIGAFGQQIPASVAGSFIFINSVLSVLPDGSAFRRGDSNLDDQVDLSDAVYTLGFLFLGSGELGCPDAADANDDGTLDISDPVLTLGRLFLGGGELPPPGGERGKDPTPDSLGCYRAP